jgi:cytochrome c2
MMSEKPLASLQWQSIVALATIAGIWAALPAVANAAEDAAAGQQIFQEKCVACHTVGKGALLGPDLKGVTERRPREWLEQWILAPDAMLAKKDPVAIELLHQFRDLPMPNQGLKTSEVTAILAYLATSGAAGTTEPATSAPAVQGNPAIGKDLFTGVVRFQNGGPPCMPCHSVAGIGALGGGQLGPDLTTLVARFGGAAAADAFIAGTPTPTMRAVWSQRPMTTDERANVVAFLTQAAVSQRPAEAIWQLAGLAALGLVVLLALAGLNWRNRLRNGVWRPMVSAPTTGPGAFHRTIADERQQQKGPFHGGWFTGPFHDGWKARFNLSDNDTPRGPANAPRRR